MKLHGFRVALLFVACAAFTACSVGAHTVPADPSNASGLHTRGGEPPADGGGDDGSDGTATPAPQATPDSLAENSCTAGGGAFYDDVGGSGVICAGLRNGPMNTSSYNARCGYTIQMSAAGGTLTRNGSLVGDFTMGVEVFNDCSYNLFS